MYSENMKECNEVLASLTEMPNQSYDLIYHSMLCYLSTVADQIGATIEPKIDRLDISIQASLLSSTISNHPELENIDYLHYLVGMLFEQLGTIISREYMYEQKESSPQENDYWYQLSLAFLHYLAGGYRIQSKTILNNLN